MKHLPYLFRVIKIHTRLFLAILFGIAVALFIPSVWMQRTVTRVIFGWNSGVILYLILAFRMIWGATKYKIKTRAQIQDEGQFLILFLVIAAVIFALTSIFVELAIVKDSQGSLRYALMLLSGITIVTSWIFTHVMFALHYAHDFYAEISKGKDGGLIFPGQEDPEYIDFLYFSFIIGTSAQTADVSFSSKRMRKTGLMHCVLSFFFNTTLLALTINIASSLI
ncbi:MAG: DUF1345 domain-containing protein [Bdellovibrionaceae bacterium]|nr:DUF1345 domain-containing protein [Bdellovibrio sp.]